MNSPRIRPGSIVVAVDGSSHAERALNWAIEQARLEHRPLVVVTTEQPDGDHTNADAVAQATQRAKGVTVSGLVTQGDARSTLVDLSTDASLIVLGSRGRGPIGSLLLGSVSATVSRLALCPVIVCRPPSKDLRHGVLVGADGTASSRPVLEFAYAHAALHRLPLTVVHTAWDVVAAVAVARTGTVEPNDIDDHDELYGLLAQSIAGFTEKYPDVPVDLQVRHGLVDDVLGNQSAQWELVVVGRHPIDSVSRLVTGSIATAVVERARTDVAVVPTLRADD